jgi:tetratricopeptide (TPR) repeat protein
MRLAVLAETPETLAALRDFAVSQRGPDALRMEAAQAPTQAGLLPSGPVRFWVRDEWREVLVVGYDIHNEPTWEHSPEVEEWLREATLALHDHNPGQAEQLLRRGLAVEPQAPDLINNLAVAYEQQGRRQEARELIRRIFEQHPDYPFARISMSQLSARDGKFEEAEALLRPLLERRRFHFSEFEALCHAMIDLYVAKGNRDAARSWLEMWAATDPDNPRIADLRRRIGQPGETRGLFGRRS